MWREYDTKKAIGPEADRPLVFSLKGVFAKFSSVCAVLPLGRSMFGLVTTQLPCGEVAEWLKALPC
jgi:hypothetical protein